MLADTDFYIDYMRGDAKALAKRRELIAEGDVLRATALTLHELHVGAALFHRPEEERRRIGTALLGLPILPYDARAARLGGEIEGTLQRGGIDVDRADIMNAAVAQIHGESILTRNLRDYRRIGGVTLESY